MKTKSPKMRAVWLGQALKEIREAVKLTTRQVGDHVGKDSSTISRIENAEQPISEEVLKGFLDYCGVTDSHRRSDLLIIRNDVAQGGWWDGYRKDVAATLMDRAWMESKAISIQSFVIEALPGLLQLPEYARALMRHSNPHRPDTEISRWTDMRMQRQHILSKHRPVKFDSIIDEQVLHRVAGTREVMHEQLDYLAEVGQRPNVSIRVLPSDKCAGVAGSFELFELTDPYPEIAYVATQAGDICVEGEPLIGMTEAYDQLVSASFSPEASRDQILAVKDKL